jgi:hypothetical protein
MSSAEMQRFKKRPYTRLLIPDAETGTYTAQILERRFTAEF